MAVRRQMVKLVVVQRKFDFRGKRRFYCRCSFEHFEKFSSQNLYRRYSVLFYISDKKRGENQVERTGGK